jgi:hypothetical protein
MYNEAALERLAPGDGETRVPKAHEYEIAREGTKHAISDTVISSQVTAGLCASYDIVCAESISSRRK